ncbi:hypothetical protein [Ruminococcus sp.]|uniref:hypothetical protein n=1 Tax=Ruminococcus sp. TaxID=41978 RepID=UPI0025ED4559|nr:hypothetical protein [Ruminococcus sp.]MBQ8965538.1 hypothetical protein [Ruminococcus sp.]
MKSILKKNAAMLCAGAMSMSFMAVAVTASAEEIPEPDENGVYGQAGIAWMIMDWWDYRRGTSEPAMDEMGSMEISSTYHDVNITGNGSYTVDMSGYDCKDVSGGDYYCGYFGLYLELPLEAPDEEKGIEPTVVVTIDDVTIDGVKYTFVEQPIPEDSELDGKLLKIKNAYGEPAVCEPEMDNYAWATTDPITINFTITGLPTDKIEDFPDETVEKICGNGDIANDPPIGGEAEESEAADPVAEEEPVAEEAPAETEAAVEEEKPEETSAAESKKEEPAAEKQEEKSNTGLIVGICAAAVAVIGVVIALIAKKKK